MLRSLRAFMGISPDDVSGYRYDDADDETESIYLEDDTSNHEVQSDFRDFSEDDSVEVAFDDHSSLSFDDSIELAFDDSSELSFDQDPSVEIGLDRPSRKDSVSEFRPAEKTPIREKRRDHSPRPEPKPKVVTPRSFDDAKTIADGFKSNVPIVMNLTAADQELVRRLIDFASGLCYVSDGSMERIRSRVFLLTPVAVNLDPRERQQLATRRYDH